MSEDKVLGSDEFMMAFFKACWSILKWTWYTFEKSINASVIALIPKKHLVH